MTDPSVTRLAACLRPETVHDRGALEELLVSFAGHAICQPCMESVCLRVADRDGRLGIEGWVCYPAQHDILLALVSEMSLSGIGVNVSTLPTSNRSSEFIRMDGEENVGWGLCPTGQGSFAPVGQRPHPTFFPACRKVAVGHGGPAGTEKVAYIWSVGDLIRPIHKVGNRILCQAENGYLGWVEEEDLALDDCPPQPRSFRTSRQMEVLCEVASEYLGVPYIWGGTGFEGIDCSGFVETVYRRCGLVLARDAHQQMLGGRIVATHDHRVPLRAGDLLFFTHEDGRVGHVGISLGGWEVIHAEEPEVRTFSLRPEDDDHDPYRSRHFVMAKRYLL